MAFLLHPAKERFVRFVQAFKHILKDLGADSLEFGELRLEVWKLVTLVEARDGDPMLPVSAPALVERDVIERAAGLEPAVCVGCSLTGHASFIQECFSHFLNCI